MMLLWGASGALCGVFEILGYVSKNPLDWQSAHEWRRWLVILVFIIGFALLGPFGAFLRRHN